MDKNVVSEHVLCIYRRTKYGAHGDTFFLGCLMEWKIDIGQMSTNKCRASAGQHSKSTNSRQHERDYCAVYLQSDPVMPPLRNTLYWYYSNRLR